MKKILAIAAVAALTAGVSAYAPIRSLMYPLMTGPTRQCPISPIRAL